MAEWSVVVTDTANRTRAFAEVSGLSTTRVVNAGGSLTGKVRALDRAAAELEVGSRVVKAYRDGVLRFRGRVGDPLTYTPGWVEFTAYDPWWWLGWRRFQVEEPHGATAGQVIAAVLATQDARKPTHLRVGATDQSAAHVDAVFAEDAVVSDALRSQLCEVSHGVWVRIDPVEDGSDAWGEVAVLYPNPGVDRPGARFEYGDGTRANVTDYSLQHGLPKNSVRATGASFGDAAEVAFWTDTASQDEYGLIDDSEAFTDESDTESLSAHAQESGSSTPPRTWQLTPLSADEAAEGRIVVPTLWDDFDVGDTVRGLIVDGVIRERGTVRVTEATVDVSDSSGRESLSSLTLEVPT